MPLWEDSWLAGSTIMLRLFWSIAEMLREGYKRSEYQRVTLPLTGSRHDLLVVADPSSQSGKTRKARQLGVPIASVADFVSAQTGGSVATT